MRTPEAVRRLHPSVLFASLAALFIAAGGYVHLREWLDVYRKIPAEQSGAFVVRVGFPVNAGLSLVVASAVLAVMTRRWSRFALPVLAGAFLFQGASLATLIATRTGSVLGWTEPIWTRGAKQSLAVEVGALVTLLGAAALHTYQQRTSSRRRDDVLAVAPSPA